MLSIIDVVEKNSMKKGIQGFVEAFQEEGFSFEKIVEKLSDKYDLAMTDAEAYVKRFWKTDEKIMKL